MVEFVVGTANLDVSGRVRSEIISMLEKGNLKNHIIYIVPEQFEYETEREIYVLLRERNLLTRSGVIEIRTFTSLINEILSQCDDALPLADDVVKSIAMFRAANDSGTELQTLGGIRKKHGFSQKILGTIDAFKAVGVGAIELEKAVDEITHSDNPLSGKTLLIKKLADVSLLFTNYNAQLSGRYLDAADRAMLAADRLVSSGIFGDCNVFVDCFNDFTFAQLQFIKRMITAADNVMFGFSADYNSKNEVFSAANANISAITAAADSEGIPTRIINDGIQCRIADGSILSELVKNAFGGGKSTVQSDNYDNSIELVASSDIYEELDYVCSKIISLTEQKKFRYKEIAVLCADNAVYSNYAEIIFKKYNIPVYLDARQPIISMPLVNAVLATLSALQNFNVDTVLSCVKTGFYSKYDAKKEKRVGLSDYDINTFENYIFEWAIETSHLKKPFTFKNSFSETDYEQLAAEEVRKGTAEPLWKLSKEISKGTTDGAVLTEKIYYFIKDTMGIQRVITSDTIADKRTAEKVELYTRLWNAVAGILESLHRELSGVQITLSDYTELFRELCTAQTLSTPPKVSDCVLVGDIDRTRASGVKAAFIVGASYESFPTPAVESGIFSQYETELIRSGFSEAGNNNVYNLNLKSIREQFSLSLYRAYKAVSLPCEYLCVSYPRMSSGGDNSERSEIITKISESFNLRVKSAGDFPAVFFCRSERAAKLRFAENLSSNSRENAVLGEALRQNSVEDGVFVEKLLEIHNEHDSNDSAEQRQKLIAHNISPQSASLLFPEKIGATAIEKLSACKFNFFAEYGLNIRQRNQRTFNPTRRGDAIHYVLEKVIGCYSGDLSKLCALHRAELQQLSREYLSEYCALETNNTFAEDARSRFLFENIANSAADVLIAMQAEFYARGYRPKFFELDLNSKEPQYIPDNDGKISSELAPAELYSETSQKSPEPAQTGTVPSPSDGNEAPYILTSPLKIKISDTQSVIISGRIDRVDMFTVNIDNDNKTYVRAVDYKSSVHSFNLCNAMSGMNIQMLLYLIALLEANKYNPTVNLTAGGLSYIPSKSSGAVSDITTAFRLLAMSHRQSSLLVKDSNTLKDYDEYTRFLTDRIIQSDGMAELMATDDISTLSPAELQNYQNYKKSIEELQKSFTPDEYNQINLDKFDELKKDLLDFITQKLSELFSGDVSAIPLIFKEKSVDAKGKSSSKTKSPCDYCRFGDICKNCGKCSKEVKEKDWQNKYSDFPKEK